MSLLDIVTTGVAVMRILRSYLKGLLKMRKRKPIVSGRRPKQQNDRIFTGPRVQALATIKIHRLHARTAEKEAARLTKEAEKKEEAAER